MRIVDTQKEITGYAGSHTVFRHNYDSGSHHCSARFAVRRVDMSGKNETQMETCLERTKHANSKSARTTSQHMSICMTPDEAVRFAAAIAPELVEIARILVLGDGTADNLQRALDAANAVLKQLKV